LERPGSVGRPTGGAGIRIQSPDGAELPSGEEGEIFAMPPGGPGSSYRYIGAERRATVDGWESVGDIGHLDADGYLYLADRRADLIITGGVNVWPAEVEAALLAHPAVRSCAVVGAPDDDLGQRVHAIIESDESALGLDDLRAFLTTRLSREKHPRSLALQEGPVRDDAGKVRKTSCIVQGTPT
jgi:bile acid-coenzyme A ligase